MNFENLSYPRGKIKVILLENVHSAAEVCFRDEGYSSVERLDKALKGEELNKVVNSAHILGIRSKTELKGVEIFKNSPLIAVGCFCIGTNQVDLKQAAKSGIPVFNAPFSNTRSVAELTIAMVIMLARRASEKNLKLHRGEWDKSADACFEVRGKTIGIIGYGHIGPQVGLLAEALGMKVIFYDVVNKLALGNSQQLPSLERVLRESDFVTLHVPETKQTQGMIAKDEIALMKKGGYLINHSRGSVVDIEALTIALKSKHLAGAAIDVFPYEPPSNSESFESQLRGIDNVILTPHIAGSTEEAQRNIGIEVAQSLIKYSNTGSTGGVVNFPAVDLPQLNDSHRILNIHHNVPGVIRDITQIIAEAGGNIRSQYLGTAGEIGYLIMDIDQKFSSDVKEAIQKLTTSIKTRILY
jgi:D-3-phosphoglycerate dehydrogenase